MLTKAVESEVPCKCCGNTSVLYDVCDFNKSCLDHNGQVFPVKGVPIYYHKCRSCGFIFTTAFDDWPLSAFRTHIYNDQYIQVDPDYKALRPNANAKFIISAFKRVKEEIRIVDYGGGDMPRVHLRFSSVAFLPPLRALISSACALKPSFAEPFTAVFVHFTQASEAVARKR